MKRHYDIFDYNQELAYYAKDIKTNPPDADPILLEVEAHTLWKTYEGWSPTH